MKNELPADPRTPFPYCPLMDQIRKARETLEDAQRALAEADAKAKAAPDDKALADALAVAIAAEADAADTLEDLENQLAEQPDQPVYLLRVPTFRTNTRFSEIMALAPPSPSDRRMFRAIKKAGIETGEIPADDADLLAVEQALRSSGADLPDALAGVFEDLYARVEEHPAVRAVVAARTRSNGAVPLLKVRFHLLGFKNVEGDFVAVGDMATEETTDLISPLDVYRIANKVDELNALRMRLGKSSSSRSRSRPSASASALAQAAEPVVDLVGEAKEAGATEALALDPAPMPVEVATP